jgi:hypothetical protein
MSTEPAPQVDWYGTGLRVMVDHGENAVDIAAAILQNALAEMFERSMERRILSQETSKSPKKLALQAVGAFETAGGLYQVLLKKLSDAERAEFDEALRNRAQRMLSEMKTNVEKLDA